MQGPHNRAFGKPALGSFAAVAPQLASTLESSGGTLYPALLSWRTGQFHQLWATTCSRLGGWVCVCVCVG